MKQTTFKRDNFVGWCEFCEAEVDFEYEESLNYYVCNNCGFPPNKKTT